jgi:hypothetical protein
VKTQLPSALRSAANVAGALIDVLSAVGLGILPTALFAAVVSTLALSAGAWA